jgi:hypothetical protein
VVEVGDRVHLASLSWASGNEDGEHEPDVETRLGVHV